MLTKRIGWEVMNLSGGGVNIWWIVASPIVVRGLQLSISLGFPNAGSGFSEALAVGYFSKGWPTFSQDAMQHVRGPYFDDLDTNTFIALTVDNPENFSVLTGPPLRGNGTLFASILKTCAPQGVSQEIDLTGLDMTIGNNNCFVLHMDGVGVPMDAEMQGVLFYEYAGGA